jgi:hypothetical protein
VIIQFITECSSTTAADHLMLIIVHHRSFIIDRQWSFDNFWKIRNIFHVPIQVTKFIIGPQELIQRKHQLKNETCVVTTISSSDGKLGCSVVQIFAPFNMKCFGRSVYTSTPVDHCLVWSCCFCAQCFDTSTCFERISNTWTLTYAPAILNTTPLVCPRYFAEGEE